MREDSSPHQGMPDPAVGNFSDPNAGGSTKVLISVSLIAVILAAD